MLGMGVAGASADPSERVSESVATGAGFLEAAVSARAVVVASVGSPEALDARAWLASLTVQRVLRGSLEAGDRIHVAWDQLVPGRPPRFVRGATILVALDPLPGWSIWRQRLGGREALGIAGRGRAFVRDPRPGTLERVARLLLVPASRREEAEGVEALVALMAGGPDPLAWEALERMADVAGLQARLSPEAVATLSRVLLDPGSTDRLREELIALVGERRLEGLRAPLVELSSSGSSLAGAAWEARVQLEGGLAQERASSLLEHETPALRAVALVHLPASMEPDPALEALRTDPAPEARAAAVEGLVARRGLQALEPALDALADPAEPVRSAAIVAIGQLGAPAVPALLSRLEGKDVPAATPLVLALAQTGPEGREALGRLAATHEHERVRRFARFLLGMPSDAH